MKKDISMGVSKFVVLWTVWYLVNSFNYTLDTGGFQLTSQDKINKKIKRLSNGNLLEYFLIYHLQKNGYNFIHDKDNPFFADNGVDIQVLAKTKKINLFCKGSNRSSMVGQIRKPLLDKYIKQGGYLLLAEIKHQLLENLVKVINLNYLGNGGKFATDKKLISIEEIEKILNIKNYDNVMNSNDINILGIIDITLAKNYMEFVKYGEKIPGVNFTQEFKEGSYFIKKELFNKLETLKEVIQKYN